MKKIKIKLLLLGILMFEFPLMAQDIILKSPEVGRPIPKFTLSDIQYYEKKNVSQADFIGKWLILDFFSESCSACFKSFPKINELQKEFKD